MYQGKVPTHNRGDYTQTVTVRSPSKLPASYRGEQGYISWREGCLHTRNQFLGNENPLGQTEVIVSCTSKLTQSLIVDEKQEKERQQIMLLR